MSRLLRSGQLLGWSTQIQYIGRSEEHTSELQSQSNLVCRLLLEKKSQTDRSRRVHEALKLVIRNLQLHYCPNRPTSRSPKFMAKNMRDKRKVLDLRKVLHPNLRS